MAKKRRQQPSAPAGFAAKRHHRNLWAGAILAWGAGVLTCGTVLLSAAAPAYAASEPAQALSKQEIIAAFQQRVFFDADNGEKALLKWEVPIRFGLESDIGVSPAWLKVLADDIAEVQAATHHEMTVTTGHINFLIAAMQDVQGELQMHRAQWAPFFVSDAEYQGFASAALNPRAACAGKFLFSTKNTIIAYLLIVKTAPAYDENITQACLLTEIMKGVGLLRRRAGEKDVSTSHADEKNFTETDRTLLRLLYDPQLPSGTREPQAMAIISKILGAEH
jgi:hypothetical protein